MKGHPKNGIPKNSVSADRIRPIVQEQIQIHGTLNEPRNSVLPSGQTNVASMTGINEKTIRYIAKGQQKWWDVSTLDKFLTKLDLLHLTYLTPEEGGFKDVYDNMTPMGQSKYASQTKNRPKVKCSCGALMNVKSAKCVKCYNKERADSLPKCVDCATLIRGGHRRTKTPRCWDCWIAYKKNHPAPEASRKGKNRCVGRKGYGA